jgi:hypothetical protein
MQRSDWLLQLTQAPIPVKAGLQDFTRLPTGAWPQQENTHG